MTEPIRVLYAEDNPYDADLTQARFAQAGDAFRLDHVDTGAACLAHVSQAAYDVLLLDYRLPDMDGLELLKHLMQAGVSVPSVMVTGLGDEALVVQALRLGASDYVPKSHDYLDTLPDILINLVRETRLRPVPARLVSAARRQVLYVERHTMDIDLTVRHLAEAAPHLVLTVTTSCEDALRRLTQAADFDLVMVDLRMSDMSALDFMREIKHRGWRMPVIVISGQGDEETAVAALKLGAADYLVKRENYLIHLPFAIEHAIEQHQLDQTNVELRREIAERQRAEDALRIKDNAIESSINALAISDLAGTLTYVNPAFLKVWGYPSSEQVLGRNATEFWQMREQALEIVNALQTQGGWVGELTAVRGDGTEFEAEISASLVRDKSGQPLAMLAAFVDITERKQAASALQQSHAMIVKLTAQVPGVVYQYRLYSDGRSAFPFASPGMNDIYEVTPDEVREDATPVFGRLHPDDYANVVDLINDSAQTLKPFHCEFRVVLPRQGLRWRLSDAMPERMADGGTLWHGIISDITERKQIEEALRASEEQKRLILQTAMDGFWVVDTQGRLLEVNNAYCQMSGYSAAELLNMRISNLEAAEANEDTAAHVQKIMALGEDRFETQHRRKDGRAFDIEVSVQYRPDNGGRLWAFLRDITDRKLAEAALQRYTQRLENLHAIDQAVLQAQSSQAIAEAALQRIEQLIPSQRASIVAYNPLTDEGLVLAEIDHDAAPRAIGPRLSWSETYGTRRSDLQRGQPIIMRNILARVKESPALQTLALVGIRRLITMPLLAHEQLVGVLNLASGEASDYSREQLDIIQEVANQLALALHQASLYEQIQRHAAELEARVIKRTAEVGRERERLRAILDAAGDGMVFTNLTGEIEYINPAMERLTGYTIQEAFGQNPRVWQGGQTPRATYEQMWTAIAGGETWRGEMINRRRDGTLYDASLTVAPLYDAERGIVGYVGALRDITRQKELDRLKDQFVSNVSHELRTPLTSIMLYVDLLNRGKPEKREHYLTTLQREAERLNKMIEDLLDISRLDRRATPIKLAPLDLNEVVGQLVADRATLAAARQLTLEFRPTAAVPHVLGELSSLTQVISNLLTNALNYTPAGGCVTVQTHAERTAGQDWLTVTVRDTGPGIAGQELPHLFERFYRGDVGRRASAPGTGLGLAISKEIMERLGGRITVESQPGQGAAFTAWLHPL